MKENEEDQQSKDLLEEQLPPQVEHENASPHLENNETQFSDIEKIKLCEEWALTKADPVFKGKFRFLFLLLWSANRIGVDSDTIYEFAKVKYLDPNFSTNGYAALVGYCYGQFEKHGTLNPSDLRNVKPPREFFELIGVKRFITYILRGNDVWNEDQVLSGSQSARIKKNLVRALYQFQTEQCYYEKWVSKGIEGLSILVNAQMELTKNALTDKLYYKGLYEGAKLNEMTSAKMWGFLEENCTGLKPHEVSMFLHSTLVEEFDPIKDYFHSLPEWDGVDHIANLVKHVKIIDEKKLDFHTQFEKHLVRSVGCSFGESINRYVFVFSGAKQFTGKSTFIRFLNPPKLMAYYSESPLRGNKDDQIRLSESFIINLEELSTLTSRDVNELKAFISSASSNERRPYDRDSKVRIRRANFFASTNREQFLSDDTGNTRWLIFAVDGFDWNYSTKIDIDKVWSQAYHLYKNGDTGEMSTEERVNQNTDNSSYEVRSLEHEFITEQFSIGTVDDGAQFWTNLQIMEFYHLTTHNSVRLNPVILGRAFKQLGFIPNRATKNGLTHRGWWVIPSKTGYSPGQGNLMPCIIAQAKDSLFDI